MIATCPPQARDRLDLLDGHAHPDRVAGKDRRGEFPLQPAEGHNRVIHKTQAHGQAAGDAEHKQAVGDALAEQLIFAVLSIGVDQVVVAREAGKVDDIGFRDRTPDALHTVAGLEFLEIEPAWTGQLACGDHGITLGVG